MRTVSFVGQPLGVVMNSGAEPSPMGPTTITPEGESVTFADPLSYPGALAV
jgi:hypothetical protein